MFRLIFALVALLPIAVQANPYEAKMRAYLAQQVDPWLSDPVLIAAIKEQNARNAAITQDQIDAEDKAWREEVGKAVTPVITTVMQTPASDFLRDKVKSSGGALIEAFVMDDHGLNVAASSPTSDAWQGDEAKFTETFPKGKGAIDVGEVSFDESSQTYEGQISTVILDPDSGKPIGAITLGLNPEALN